MKTIKVDLAIIGGGVGGCAAALAAAEAGIRVVLTEETDWIGGQLTSQAVPPDEHGWIERFGCTAKYRSFRERVRQYYRYHYPLLEEVAADPRLNPGNGWVSPICHEPRVALAVLEAMLAPYVSAGRLLILRKYRPIAVDYSLGDVLRSVTLQKAGTGDEIKIEAPYFLDATENGDLAPLGEIEHVTGSESRSQTGEPSAGEKARIDNVQAFSMCFVLEEAAEESPRISPPENYAFWRDYQPKLLPPWPGRLLCWEGLNPRTMKQMKYRFEPHREKPYLFSGLWAFRRIIDRAQFKEGFYQSDVCLVNWPMIDYMEGDLLTCTETERNSRIAHARQLSLAMVYWLQTEAPREDGGHGWPKLRLRGDLLGTDDGIAMAPYIREARRYKTLKTICEQDVSAACRPHDNLGERYEDSVGLGHYRIDLHPTSGGDNYVDVASLPFQIPLGALIPVCISNVLPAAKNIGTTHITNGCYRLHPVEWNIGEVAGALAAYCLQKNLRPSEVQLDQKKCQDFQAFLVNRGVEIAWPEDLVLDEGDPHIHALEEKE